MNDMERELRALLRGKASDIGEPDVIPPGILGRARVRRAATASLLVIALLAVGVGGVGASRALFGPDEWEPATPLERLLDVDRFDHDMTPAGPVQLIAEGHSEKGPFAYLGWTAEAYDVCLQFVVDGDARHTSCYPSQQPPGPLYLSASRSAGWEDRLVDGMADPDVARLEARMSGGLRIDVPLYPAPEGLSVKGRNFVVGFVPGAVTGELVAFDARGERLGAEPLPYLDAPDAADEPRLDEQIDKVTLARGDRVGDDRVAWRYRAWRKQDGGLCTEIRLKGPDEDDFYEGQSRCLPPDQLERLGAEALAVERWLWYADAAFVAGFASGDAHDIGVRIAGRPTSADVRLVPVDAALGSDLSGFHFVAGWIPAVDDAEIVALGPPGRGERGIGLEVVDARGPQATSGPSGTMSFEQCEDIERPEVAIERPEVARLFRLFGSQPARLATALEALLLPTEVCSVGSSSATVKAAPAKKPKGSRRN